MRGGCILNLVEASDLCTLVREESALRPELRQIANGECVVIIHKSGERQYYLWNVDDWEQYKKRYAGISFDLMREV